MGQIKFADGVTEEEAKRDWPWLFEANTEGAVVGRDGFGRLVWHGGDWHGGDWHDGDWHDGDWHDGVWCGGVWHDGVWHDGVWHDGDWHDGVWRGGVWHGGYWRGGYWRGGVWHGGGWHGGDWHGGDWRGGEFRGGYSAPAAKWFCGASPDGRIKIGCKEKSIPEWDAWFAGGEVYDTPRGTEKFKRIHAAYLASRAFAVAMGYYNEQT